MIIIYHSHIWIWQWKLRACSVTYLPWAYMEEWKTISNLEKPVSFMSPVIFTKMSKKSFFFLFDSSKFHRSTVISTILLETFHCLSYVHSLEFIRYSGRGTISFFSPLCYFIQLKEFTGKDLNRRRTFNRLDGHTIDSVLARKLSFNWPLVVKGILSLIFYHLKMKIRP